MRVPRLFTDQSLQEGQRISLVPEASKYLVRVLRMQVGNDVEVFNGDGYNYLSTIIMVEKTTVLEVRLRQPNPTESPLKITLVQSLAKGSKLDLIIQKATELGTTRITPVSNERSILRVDEQRAQRKLDHWRSVAVSACAQCNRSTVPTIDRPASFADWLSQSDSENALLLHPHTTDSFSDITLKQQVCTIIVGPEGGFSEAEYSQAIAHGIKPVRCGPRVMRTETAGFAAISILQARFGDLR